MALEADPDRVVFETPIVKVGAFRCPVGHPRFVDSGPAKHYCFVFPRNACWIEHQGERPFVADASVIPLYNPGRPYRRAAIDPAGDATDWFGVDPALLRDMIAEFDPETAAGSDHLFRRGAVDASADLFLAQRRVFNHVNTAGTRSDALFVEEVVVGALSEVLRRAYARVAKASRSESHASLAARARAHLGRRFLTRETVGDMANALGVSPFHLCRVFRRETGHSLHRYRTDLRLRWSLQPLADGVDILAVALAAGFAHHSHFTTEFRRTFGVRPSEFRSGAVS
jgi:AraC-like DNA-binding protein